MSLTKKILIAAAGLVAVTIVVGPVRGFPIADRLIFGPLSYFLDAREGDLTVGDPAPDVELIELTGGGGAALSGWIGPRPLVLIFGSFT